MDGLMDLLNTLLSQLVNIPLNNALAVIYVILNALLLFFGGTLS